MAGGVAYLQQLAQSAPFQAPYDYRQAPLGSVAGEEGLVTPYNQVALDAMIRVRNWSGLMRRKVIVEAISGNRGGARSTAKGGPYFGRTPEELQRLVRDEGRDMNWYEEKVEPIRFGLKFDGQTYIVEPTLYDAAGNVVDPHALKGEAAGVEPRWMPVPSGVWDLYMGNWERMHSRDMMERSKEMEALQGRGLHRWVISSDNPNGILEFMREPIQRAVAAVDRDRVAAGDLVEV